MKKVMLPALLSGLIILNACQSKPTAPGLTSEDYMMHAMQARGFQMIDGEWMADEELKGFKLDENGVPKIFYSQAAPVGLCMNAAIKYDATPEDIDKLKKGLQRFSQLIWNDTYGNMFIKKVILLNNGDKAYLTLEKMAQNQGGHAYFGGLITVGVNLLDIGGDKSPDIGLRVFGAGILHEFNHSMFHLPDEYPYKGQPDKPVKKCVMDPRSRITPLCADCEVLILKRFPSFKFPAEAERAAWPKANPVPEIYFVIK
ncbi:MAG: hypothetical protein HY811_10125 [Planctomycetes bacterium]|nr:hypothetical protein [Planctomycetota bacterium]